MRGCFDCIRATRSSSAVLSPEELKQYKAQGYIVVSNAVSPVLIQRSRSSIEEKLAAQNLQGCKSWQDVDKVVDSGFFDEDSFINNDKLFFRAHRPSQLVSSTTSDSEFSSLLYDSGLLERAYTAMNPTCAAERVRLMSNMRVIRLAQVALRYPGAAEGGRHIDGVERGISSPFDCLVGVALSDQTQTKSGNLIVWPGSHITMRRRLAEANLKPVPCSPEETAEQRAMIREMVREAAPGEGEELLLRPGDAVIADQKLVHSGGANTTPHLRTSVYFRITAPPLT